MIWNMPVQCRSVEDQAAIKETVESLSRLGYPELIVRSAMRAIRYAVSTELKEHVGVRAIAQAAPTCDSVSAGMLKNAIKPVKR